MKLCKYFSLSRKRRHNVFAIIFILLFNMLTIPTNQVATAATSNVTIELNNNTPSFAGTVVGIGGETDPFAFMYHQTIKGVTEDDFDKIMTKIRKAGISFVRMWLQSDWWEPVNDNNDPNVMNNVGFAWNSQEMSSVYKYLDALKILNVDVLIDIFGGNEQKMYPWMYWSANSSSAPANDKRMEYAENIASVVKHLVITKGYSNIKFVSLYNEPESFFLQPPGFDRLSYLKTIYTDVYNRLQSEGLLSYVKMSGPESVMFTAGGENFYSDFTQNMNPYLGAYTVHASVNSKGLQNGSFTLKASDLVNQKNANDPNGASKPLMFSETAAIPDTKGTVDDGLAFASIIADGLRKGVVGFSKWRLYDDVYPVPALANQTLTGDADYGWGWFNGKQDDYTPKFIYYIGALLGKYIKKGSVTFTAASSDTRVIPAIVKTSDGKYTIVVVNWTNDTVNANYVLQQPMSTTLKKYSYQSGGILLDSFGALPSSSGTVAVNGTTFSDVIPPKTVFLYTDIPDSILPSSVIGLTGSSPDNKKVTLSWSANSDADLGYYRIYRDTNSEFISSSANLIGEIWNKPGSSLSFNDMNVAPGTTYYYKVSAVDTSENEGPASNEISVTTAENSYGNSLISVNDETNQYYEISSSYDGGYKVRISKSTGTIAFIEDANGNTRSIFGNETYSFPVVYKYSNGAFTDKILNGGAESGSSSPDYYWNWTDGSGIFQWDSTISHSGNKSLKISNNANYHSTWIQDASGIIGGKKYRFNYWMKTSDVSFSDGGGGSGAYAWISFRDASGNTLNSSGASLAIQDSHDWTPISLEIGAPAGAVTARIQLQLWNTAGTVWFDDMKLVEMGDIAISGNTFDNKADSVTFSDISPTHKQIRTVRGAETLYYDFHPQTIDIKIVGNNSGGYIFEDGGYQLKTNGRAVWSDGTISDLSLLKPNDSIQRNGNSFSFQQFVSPYGLTYRFGAAKNVSLVNGYRQRGYYSRFQMNSDEVFSIDFTKINHSVNSSFESGTGMPLNWLNWSNGSGALSWDTTDVLDGGHSAKIENTSPAASLWYQSISSPETDKEVELTGWVKTSSVSGGHGAFIALAAYDANGNNIGEAWSPAVTGTTSTWKPIKVRLTLPYGTASVQISGRLWASTGTAWFDKFDYVVAHNAAANPGAEYGASSPDGWYTFTTSASLSWDSSIYHGTGFRSLKVANGTAQNSAWVRDIPNLQRGKEYEFGCWIKTSGVTGGDGAFAAVAVKDWDGNIIQESWSTPVFGTQDWTFVKGKIVLPPHAESVFVNGRLWGSTGVAWFDDFSLKLMNK